MYRSQRLFWSLVGGLLLFNASYFIIKHAQIIWGMDTHDPIAIQDFLSTHVKSGSRVVGSPVFYYAITTTAADYELNSWYGELEDREMKHREEWNYEYLITSKEDRPSTYYMSKSQCVLIDSLVISPSEHSSWVSSLGIGGARLVAGSEDEGYSCYIYKRTVSER